MNPGSSDFAAEVLAQLGKMNDKLDSIRQDISQTKLEVVERTVKVEQDISHISQRVGVTEAKLSVAEQMVGSRASTAYAVKLDERLQTVEKKQAEESATSKTRFNFISFVGGTISTGAVAALIRFLFH